MALIVVMFVGCFIVAALGVGALLSVFTDVKTPWSLLIMVPVALALQNWVVAIGGRKTIWFGTDSWFGQALNVAMVASVVGGGVVLLRMEGEERKDAFIERCIGRAVQNGQRVASAERGCLQDWKDRNGAR